MHWAVLLVCIGVCSVHWAVLLYWCVHVGCSVHWAVLLVCTGVYGGVGVVLSCCRGSSLIPIREYTCTRCFRQRQEANATRDKEQLSDHVRCLHEGPVLPGHAELHDTQRQTQQGSQALVGSLEQIHW